MRSFYVSVVFYFVPFVVIYLNILAPKGDEEEAKEEWIKSK